MPEHALIQYINNAFLLFTFPLIGLFLDAYLPKKMAYWVIGISFILLLPVFFSYRYTIYHVFGTLALILTSTAFGLYLREFKRKRYKFLQAIILSIGLFLLFVYLGFTWSFRGAPRLKQTWYIKNYRIEYFVSQGFAGPPTKSYVVSKYAAFRLLIKAEEVIYDNGRTENCFVWFIKTGVVFDKCRGILDTGETSTNAKSKRL